MTTAMGHPTPRNPSPSPETEQLNPQTEESMKVPMAPPPPPPRNPNHPDFETTSEQNRESDDDLGPGDEKKPAPVRPEKQQSSSSSVPYTIPEWSSSPSHPFYLEVLKDGSIIDQFDVCEKGAYMFGRADICDFVLEHPTISRFHAVLQFKRSGDAYLYDLGSTHGTFVNKNQVDKRVYVDLHVGDVLRFGGSTRLYIFQGPTELMPPEKDLNIIREAKVRQEMLDREASLRRARREASMADGISWGIGEDAIEEEEDDMDEVTWQNYKGLLTEKQEKTREKVLKRLEKIAHMKKEIAAIRAKDISQGGLTQGQQTQIARNEQRIAQLMEELENLEETLNESIRESLGARSGKITRGKRKGATEEDDEFSSDEDEFYDRTKKKPPTQTGDETQTVETADTLLDKKENIMKEIEEKEQQISAEKNKMDREGPADAEPGDSLDAYMSGLSSQLVHDRTVQLEQELSSLQSELDRILYLLKIADPAGEAAKKRASNLQDPKANKSEKPKKLPPAEQKKKSRPAKPADDGSEPKKNSAPVIPANDVSDHKQKTTNVPEEPRKILEGGEIFGETTEGKPVVYAQVKPQWLGAVEDRESKETKHETEIIDTQEHDEFVNYKDRDKIVAKSDSGLESAAPGLIIRKRKQDKKLDQGEGQTSDQSTSSSKGAELMAQDAVALLLKHTRGYHPDEDEGNYGSVERAHGEQCPREKKKAKRVLGPEKPSFLDDSADNDTWVPPEGQSGDGRTSLNDRFGY